MQETMINWTELTWNPASGCTKISPECKYCYAELIAENKRGTLAFPNGFDVTMRPWKLKEPSRVKKPSLIFTNSMTDMFHKDITDAYRDDTVAAMLGSSRHRYQVLTKRPEEALAYFSTRKVPDCIWLGVTVGVNDTTWRIDVLREIKAKVRFISAEPLLEQLDNLNLSGIHWAIGGGESGSQLMKPNVLEARGMVRRGDRKAGENLWEPRDDRADWFRSLRDQCISAGTAFWLKQWGGPKPGSGGRELDGRTWNEMPTSVPGAMPDAYVHREGTQYSLPVIQ